MSEHAKYTSALHFCCMQSSSYPLHASVWKTWNLVKLNLWHDQSRSFINELTRGIEVTICTFPIHRWPVSVPCRPPISPAILIEYLQQQYDSSRLPYLHKTLTIPHSTIWCCLCHMIDKYKSFDPPFPRASHVVTSLLLPIKSWSLFHQLPYSKQHGIHRFSSTWSKNTQISAGAAILRSPIRQKHFYLSSNYCLELKPLYPGNHLSMTSITLGLGSLMSCHFSFTKSINASGKIVVSVLETWLGEVLIEYLHIYVV